MAALTVQTVSLTGLTATATAAATLGDTFVNNGRTIFRAINGSGSPIVVTVDSVINCNQAQDHNVVVSVASGATTDIGPFPMDRFNSGATGAVSVTYGGVTSLTVAAISI
jgi:hypothetical protein